MFPFKPLGTILRGASIGAPDAKGKVSFSISFSGENFSVEDVCYLL